MPSERQQSSPTKNKIRVLIADDNALVRMGIQAVLSNDTGFEIAGMARDGQEAIAMVESYRPDVVLMDVQMPGMGGIEATREIKAKYPMTTVLMLSGYDIKAVITESLEAGASGYLLKDVSTELLRRTLKATRHGAAVLSSKLLKETLVDVQEPQPPDARDISLSVLSPREGQVLEHLMEGMSNRTIAEELGITEHTVKKHVQHILQKMHASDRTQAAVRAVQHGVPPPTVTTEV